VEEAGAVSHLDARVRRIHHVAFAHSAGPRPDVRLAELLGLAAVHEDRAPGFIERMVAVGEGFVQTLEPTQRGLVERFVGKRGAALHHVAFEVEGLEELLGELRSRGVPLVDDVPRPGGMGTSSAFIHPSALDGLLVELVEVPDTTVAEKGAG
jgi:methylmalonyl-CoA/ethylmalonyl-CoA epimerase